MKLSLYILLLSLICMRCKDLDNMRYILYEVNPGEGFNLRRDVFGRMAVFVKKLNLEHGNFTLVLPPWNHLYHWKRNLDKSQTKIQWKTFFDIDSIARYVPIVEFKDFLEKNGERIDVVYYLQSYKEGWKDGHFEEKWDYRECIDENPYKKVSEDLYIGYFWGYSKVSSEDFECISVQGSTGVLNSLVKKSIESYKSIMLDRAENLLHDWFGDEEYWSIRRATRFSSHLINIAAEFRKEFLNSDDEIDDTIVHEFWEKFKPERSPNKGGPYISVHLRRKDFVYARKDQIPSLKGAADQLRAKLLEFKLDTLFIATDAPKNEFEYLKSNLGEFKVFRYEPAPEIKDNIFDGEVAIIDQIICSHAKYFIGSYESTFSFRIQEEREILGFPVQNSFDVLCPDGESNCSKGSVWKIVYPDATPQNIGLHNEL